MEDSFHPRFQPINGVIKCLEGVNDNPITNRSVRKWVSAAALKWKLQSRGNSEAHGKERLYVALRSPKPLEITCPNLEKRIIDQTGSCRLIIMSFIVSPFARHMCSWIWPARRFLSTASFNLPALDSWIASPKSLVLTDTFHS